MKGITSSNEAKMSSCFVVKWGHLNSAFSHHLMHLNLMERCSLMGINLSELGPVYIVCGKTDLRKGIDSLAYLIQSQFDLDPFSKSVFLFCGGKSDRFKALYWDGEGFWLLYKRFENGRLTWPRSTTEVQALTPEQVEWLMKGFSITPKILESQSRHFY